MYENAQEPYFISRDMGCTAALIALGHKLNHVEKETGGRKVFFFKRSEEVLEDSRKYWKGELQVNALQFFNAMRNVKNFIYSST